MSNDIKKLEDIKERIENLKDAYNEMLDELYPYNVGNATYSGSTVFEKIDPIAYEVGFNNYADSEILDILYDFNSLKDIIDYNNDNIELRKKIEDMIKEYGY